jgi:hypothetical protein
MNTPALVPCLLALCAPAVNAQNPPKPAVADPLEAQAPVPPAVAPSPLAQYRRHSAVEVKPGAWRAANDTVNRVGGWRTYAREAPAPGADTAPAADAAAKPAPPAHKH